MRELANGKQDTYIGPVSPDPSEVVNEWSPFTEWQLSPLDPSGHLCLWCILFHLHVKGKIFCYSCFIISKQCLTHHLACYGRHYYEPEEMGFPSAKESTMVSEIKRFAWGNRTTKQVKHDPKLVVILDIAFNIPFVPNIWLWKLRCLKLHFSYYKSNTYLWSKFGKYQAKYKSHLVPLPTDIHCARVVWLSPALGAGAYVLKQTKARQRASRRLCCFTIFPPL